MPGSDIVYNALVLEMFRCGSPHFNLVLSDEASCVVTLRPMDKPYDNMHKARFPISEPVCRKLRTQALVVCAHQQLNREASFPEKKAEVKELQTGQ